MAEALVGAGELVGAVGPVRAEVAALAGAERVMARALAAAAMAGHSFGSTAIAASVAPATTDAWGAVRPTSTRIAADRP